MYLTNVKYIDIYLNGVHIAYIRKIGTIEK